MRKVSLCYRPRTSIGALIVIDVHAKDVCQRLAEQGIDSKDAFEWISQLRYYWEEDDTGMENSCRETIESGSRMLVV